jgi:hypothetical protein
MRGPAGAGTLLLALLLAPCAHGLGARGSGGPGGARQRVAEPGAGAPPLQQRTAAAGPLLAPRPAGDSPALQAARAAAVEASAGSAPRLDASPTVFTPAGLGALRAAGAAAAAAAHPSRPSTTAPSPRDGAPPFDPDRARLLASLQSIAYCADADAVLHWTCARCRGVPGFVPFLAHVDSAWDLSGYAGYLPSLGAKVLVFRGTDSSSWSNWVENMRAWRTDAAFPLPGAPPALRLHSGFLVMVRSKGGPGGGIGRGAGTGWRAAAGQGRGTGDRVQ